MGNLMYGLSVMVNGNRYLNVTMEQPNVNLTATKSFSCCDKMGRSQWGL